MQHHKQYKRAQNQPLDFKIVTVTLVATQYKTTWVKLFLQKDQYYRYLYVLTRFAVCIEPGRAPLRPSASDSYCIHHRWVCWRCYYENGGTDGSNELKLMNTRVLHFTADYSIILLIKGGNLSGTNSYQSLVQSTFGFPGFLILSGLQFLYPFIGKLYVYKYTRIEKKLILYHGIQHFRCNFVVLYSVYSTAVSVPFLLTVGSVLIILHINMNNTITSVFFLSYD